MATPTTLSLALCLPLLLLLVASPLLAPLLVSASSCKDTEQKICTSQFTSRSLNPASVDACIDFCSTDPGKNYINYLYWDDAGDCACWSSCPSMDPWSSDGGPVVQGILSKCKIVGKDSNGANIYGDPHFVGAHGVRFDFNGDVGKSYCLMTDSNFHINGLVFGHDVGGHLRTWFKELGIFWHDDRQEVHALHLVAESGMDYGSKGLISLATLDGSAIALPSGPGSSVNKHGMLMQVWPTQPSSTPAKVQGHFKLEVDGLFSLELNVRPDLSLRNRTMDANVHFDIKFLDVKATGAIHGIIGQTFRSTPSQIAKALKYSSLNKLLKGVIQADGKSGAGFLDGNPGDYQASAVMKPDCAFSAFLA